MTMRKISPEEFVRRIHQSEPGERLFAFLLGAGCSVSSGIPASATLVAERWLPRLQEIASTGDRQPSHWLAEAFPNYDPNDPAASYGDVLESLFHTPQERQAEVEALCDGSLPRYGYGVLAQLVASQDGRFNVVLTTNFDDLMADSLYLFTDKRPLVIVHESLASFIRPTRTRPLVIKMHGDHRLAPHNTSEETAAIEAAVENQVRALLQNRGLIVMGYGGRDEGIAKLLQSLPSGSLPWGVYWVNPSQPPDPLGPWLEARNARWVEITDFDEFMVLVEDHFKLGPPDPNRLTSVFEQYAKDRGRLSRTILSRPTTPTTSALKSAVRQSPDRQEEWRRYWEAARLERDAPERAKELYEAALQEWPQSALLLNAYGVFLHLVVRDLDAAERVLTRGLEIAPDDPALLTNWASFLHFAKKEYGEAERAYRQALEIAPNEPATLNNYAALLARANKDLALAEEYYRRAAELEPSAGHLGNLAAFLQSQNRNEEAEEFYRLAVQADPSEDKNLTRYATFLSAVRKDYDTAERLHLNAIDIAPNAVNLGNYANFLTTVRLELDKAEELYKQAVASGGEHKADVLGNYAVFLQDHRREYDQAQRLFEEALAADPHHAKHLGNFARFCHVVLEDFNRAEDLYKRALVEDPTNGTNLGNYAVLLKQQQRYDESEHFFRRAIDASPRDSAILGNYAHLLHAVRADPEAAIVYYRRAAEGEPSDPAAVVNFIGLLLTRSDRSERSEGVRRLEQFLASPQARKDADFALEAWFYGLIHLGKERERTAVRNLKRLLDRGVRSIGWDLSAHVSVAEANRDLRAEWIKTLAGVIERGEPLDPLEGWPVWRQG